MSSLPATNLNLPLQADDLRVLSELAIYVTTIGLVVDCAKCGSAVPLTIRQSDRHGNKGKPMARVSGTLCSLFGGQANLHAAFLLRLFQMVSKAT